MHTINLWDDFHKLHVIRQLRRIIGSWWKIQLNFTDQKGYLRGVEKGRFFSPLHKSCQLITKGQKGFEGCMGTVKSTSYTAKHKNQTRVGFCHVGFSTLVVPLYIEQQFLGTVFADGFILESSEKEQKKTVANYLSEQGFNEPSIEEMIHEIPVLQDKDLDLLKVLISTITEELISVENERREQKEELSRLQKQLTQRFSFGSIIGQSPSMVSLYEMIEKVSSSEATVLIQGENGTGKELVAKSIHYGSSRKEQPFVVVNCGALSESLLESELFGHVKGAFTGADRDKKGLFETAHEGTIFLDEVGDTPLVMQVKLLRVLQDGSYTPVGSAKTKYSRARVLCATNKNLEEMISAKEFRQDLYYRLNVIPLVIDPLRDKKEDIPILVDHFLKKLCEKNRVSLKKASPSCLQNFLDYSWPGNIRELENELERLIILSGKDKLLDSSLLSKKFIGSQQGVRRAKDSLYGSLKSALDDLEAEIIAEGLRRLEGNKTKLAKELGISRTSLIAKVSKYSLEKKTGS